jgi:hypothetical protein
MPDPKISSALLKVPDPKINKIKKVHKDATYTLDLMSLLWDIRPSEVRYGPRGA